MATYALFDNAFPSGAATLTEAQVALAGRARGIVRGRAVGAGQRDGLLGGVDEDWVLGRVRVRVTASSSTPVFVL